MTTATFHLQHEIFYHYLKRLHESFYQCYEFYYFFKMALSNFYARLFSTLETLAFCLKLVSHNIKVCSHYNVLKPFLVYVVKIIEMAIRFHSNCRSASQVSYVAVRQWLEILIYGLLLKTLESDDIICY